MNGTYVVGYTILNCENGTQKEHMEITTMW